MNVILISVDCLRYDRCGFNGFSKDTTPFLDELSENSLVFDRAYATGPVTTESIPGILAGRLSKHTHYGPTTYQKAIPSGANTIAGHLSDAGYSTAAVLSNPRVGKHLDTDRGFDSFKNLRLDDRTDDSDADELSSDVLSLRLDSNLGARLNQLRERLRSSDSVGLSQRIAFTALRMYQYHRGWPSVSGESVVESLEEELNEIKEPFFAWSHLMDLHGPIHPDAVNKGGLFTANPIHQFSSHVTRASDIYDPHVSARYESAVKYVDGLIANLHSRVQAQNFDQETVFIITADHGEALYERGCYGHPHHYLHDELLHVPLLVYHPNLREERTSAPFSLGWLHELIADIVGVDRMGAPITSETNDHLQHRAEDGTPIVADTLSEHGHSVATIMGDSKHIAHSDRIDLQPPRFSLAGNYVIHRGTHESSAEGVPNGGLKELTRRKLVSPDRIESTGTTISADVKDQLKQLGYAD